MTMDTVNTVEKAPNNKCVKPLIQRFVLSAINYSPKGPYCIMKFMRLAVNIVRNQAIRENFSVHVL